MSLRTMRQQQQCRRQVSMSTVERIEAVCKGRVCCDVTGLFLLSIRATVGYRW